MHFIISYLEMGDLEHSVFLKMTPIDYLFSDNDDPYSSNGTRWVYDTRQ